MKAKVFVAGTDGNRHYKNGDTCEADSSWLRRLLVNGLAEPLDDDARGVCTKPDQVARYRSDALTDKAIKNGVSRAKIPALAVRT